LQFKYGVLKLGDDSGVVDLRLRFQPVDLVALVDVAMPERFKCSIVLGVTAKESGAVLAAHREHPRSRFAVRLGFHLRRLRLGAAPRPAQNQARLGKRHGEYPGCAVAVHANGSRSTS
jgi:hypothetical protein